MHLIVDGYNVIRQSPRMQFLDAVDLQSGREALLELLAHYRRRNIKYFNILINFILLWIIVIVNYFLGHCIIDFG